MKINSREIETQNVLEKDMYMYNHCGKEHNIIYVYSSALQLIIHYFVSLISFMVAKYIL